MRWRLRCRDVEFVTKSLTLGFSSQWRHLAGINYSNYSYGLQTTEDTCIRTHVAHVGHQYFDSGNDFLLEIDVKDFIAITGNLFALTYK